MTRNLAYSTISAGSAGLMLLLLMLAGRQLGVNDFGAFTYAITIATVAEVFMDFGLHQVTVRAVAKVPTDAGRYLQTSLRLKVLPGLAMVLVFGGVVLFARPDPTVRLACLLMLLSATMRSYVLTAKGVLLGLERFGHDAFITTADRVLLLVCCGIALIQGAGLIGVSVVFLAVRVVSAVFAVGVARLHAGRAESDATLWRSLPAEALPIGAFLLVLNLYNRIDTLMLGTMAGDVPTGLYGAAYPLYEGLTYATAVVSAVLAPKLSRLWATDAGGYRHLVRQSLAGTVALSVAVGAVGWLVADIGVRYAFGPEFSTAARTLRLLILGLPFIYVIWVLHAVALSSNHTRVLLWVTGVGVLLNVGLNLILIPRYAHEGAAIATVVGEAVTMTALLYGLRRPLAGKTAGPLPRGIAPTA